MDSMRSLNRSLPSARSNRPTPPEELLPAFRQAALSVTNLYKSAASYHDSIRQTGYQDALDDLLKFLDQENLGLQDGEGWRVRQWVTARYDVSHIQQSEGEEDEQQEPERERDREREQRTSSPEKPAEEEEQAQVHPSSEQDSTLPSQSQPTEQTHRPGQPVFHFSAGIDSAMQTDDPPRAASEPRPSPVRVEVINRMNRGSHKHNSRHTPRSTNRTTPQVVGSKRKLPFPDISEIFNVSFDKKDSFDGGNGGGGGSKRSRFV